MIRYILALVLLTASAAAGHDHNDVRRFVIRSQIAQAGEGAVVFLGDSITESALLPATMCGLRVVNAGVGGTTVSGYLDTVISGIPEFRADTIVVALGTNDARPNVPVEDFRSSYTRLVQVLRPYASRIVLVGIPPLASGIRDPATAAKLNDQVRKIAARERLTFIDMQASMAGNEMTIDGIHLSPQGYRLWLSAIKLCP